MADKRDKWNLNRALDYLKTAGIIPIDKTIGLGKNDTPGLTAWGAIDYLRHYCGYEVRRMK